MQTRNDNMRMTLRRLATFAVVAGLLTRALIPTGYMPGNLLAGEFMVLCPVGLPALAQSLGHGHHDGHDGGHDGAMVDADRACPIGAALSYAALPAGLQPSTVSLTPQESPVTALRVLAQRPRAWTVQARAPPLGRI